MPGCSLVNETPRVIGIAELSELAHPSSGRPMKSVRDAFGRSGFLLMEALVGAAHIARAATAVERKKTATATKAPTKRSKRPS